MRRTRWVFGTAVVAGVVVLVAPAVGQGKAESASLGWSGSRGGPTLSSYGFGAVDGGARVSKGFRLGNAGLSESGKLVLRLTGSSRISITSDKCSGKSLGSTQSCWVGVSYAPLGPPASNSATLTATGARGAVANLSLSGSNLGPAGHVYWANYGNGRVLKVPRGGGGKTTLATGQSVPSSLAVDGTHVYWVNAGDGTVNEVPLGGGTVTTLATGQDGPYSLAVGP